MAGDNPVGLLTTNPISQARPEIDWRSAVSLVDEATGRPIVTTSLGASLPLWMVAGGHLYLNWMDPHGVRRLGRFVANPSANGYLGGASAQQWADACQLLTSGDVAAAVGSRYTSTAVRDQLHHGVMPGVNRCTFVPDDLTGAVVAVSVVWVGKRAVDAGAFIRDVPDAAFAGQLVGVGEQAIWLRTSPWGSTARTATVLIRVDRLVVRLEVRQNTAPAEPLARTVAERMSDLRGRA
jgi:hypothetical protein